MPRLENIDKAYKIDEQSRGSNPFYRSNQWRRLAKQVYLRDAGLCSSCGKVTGRKKRDYAIDHIKPLRLWNELRYSMNNLQVLCSKCHARTSNIDSNIESKYAWNIERNDNDTYKGLSQPKRS